MKANKKDTCTQQTKSCDLKDFIAQSMKANLKTCCLPSRVRSFNCLTDPNHSVQDSHFVFQGSKYREETARSEA